jgi:hypothetical protein
MRFVLGDDQPEQAVAKIATAYIRRMAWRAEAKWHPDWICSQQVTGMKYLEDLSSAGVGAIISIAHHGNDGKFPSMRAPAIDFHSMAVPLSSALQHQRG